MLLCNSASCASGRVLHVFGAAAHMPGWLVATWPLFTPSIVLLQMVLGTSTDAHQHRLTCQLPHQERSAVCLASHLCHQVCECLKAQLLNQPDQARLLTVTTGAVVPAGCSSATWSEWMLQACIRTAVYLLNCQMHTAAAALPHATLSSKSHHITAQPTRPSGCTL